MGLTSFPNGFQGGMAYRGIPILDAFYGNVIWVDSVRGANGNRGTRNKPMATIDAAIGRCTANNGDMIVAAPGHAETISAAGGIACDVAGITILGLGVGAQRPTISIGTITTASITVSAANVSWQNCRILSTFADVVKAFDVTAAGFSLLGCTIGDSAINLNFLSAVHASSTVDGTANNIRLCGNQFVSQDGATLAFFLCAADILNVVIEDNVIVSEGTGLATIFTMATGKDIRMCSVLRNALSNKSTSGNLAYSNDTASPNNSGIIADNYIGHADVTGGHTLGVVGGCRMFNNLSVSTDALSGLLIPAADVDL